MLFNSIEFFIFFPIVFIIYWSFLGRKFRFQNIFILLVSYFFYGWWDWRFLGLIILSSIVDYSLGLGIHNTDSQSRKKVLLTVSLVLNLGLLLVFKYYNFFIDSLQTLLTSFNLDSDFRTLNILLPVGISFYTFQTLSYTIDVYREKLIPEKDPIAFFAFVSFFPQLVAGPIERASNLLPQFKVKRHFEYDKAVIASRQILWGFFKKVVVADNLSLCVDAIFSNASDLNGVVLLLGAIFFSFQIYCDFSGYSDIAIGIARLLGFELKKNFNFPYFSRDIAEFWRRWHISLSTWFRDYLYIPLGGSKVSELKKLRNIFIIFLVSGFWHGANWTFIFWGLLHALLYIPLSLRSTNRKFLNPVQVEGFVSSISMFFKILVNFLVVTLAWVFFRADNINAAFNFLKNMIYKPDQDLISIFSSISIKTSLIYFNVAVILILLIVEWVNRRKEHGLESLGVNKFIRYSIYLFLALLIADNFHGQKSFIYFQF